MEHESPTESREWLQPGGLSHELVRSGECSLLFRNEQRENSHFISLYAKRNPRQESSHLVRVISFKLDAMHDHLCTSTQILMAVL